MRRSVRYQLLLGPLAAALLAGCAGSSSPEIADVTDDSPVEIDLPAESDAIPLTSSGRYADAPAERVDPESASAELPPGGDSDAPGDYARPDNQPTDEHGPEHQHAATADDEAPKRNGRAPDGDDPAAPLIVAPVTKEQDDAPLNDGRAPSAKPLPEGQRVLVQSEAASVDQFSNGRAPGAKPGDEVPRATPAQAAATTKPAAPTRAKLSDVSETVQALDKDTDGQIGMYEWPRERLGEFKKLDTNQDGFLTAAELVAGQKKQVVEAAPKVEDNSKANEGKADATPKEKPATTNSDSEKAAASEESAAETDDSEDAKADDSTDSSDAPDDSKAASEDEAKTDEEDDSPADDEAE